VIAGDDERAIILQGSFIVYCKMPAIKPEANSRRNFKQLIEQVIEEF